jgi:S-formylglutathione hydrolase FrmB
MFARLAVLLALACLTAQAGANPVRRRFLLPRVNRKLHGRVIDHTHNHGADRRIWSEALGEKRDLYVYLPPGFDPCRQYPILLFLHGFAQDEKALLTDVAPLIDHEIACGRFPPVIVAAPDGSLKGADCIFSAGSFFLNSRAGAFEDYLVVDVWNFLVMHYPIRPEPQARALVGVSMGGGAAFHKAIKYPHLFPTAVGIFPPLNPRWVDCRGHAFANFDPCNWGWRTDFTHPNEIVGRFYGVVLIFMKQVIGPLYGRRNPDSLAKVIANNPIEMLDAYDIRPGQLNLYVAYGGKDEFNLDAQVESFLYRARERGLEIAVGYDPRGRHDRATALRLAHGVLHWLAPRLAPYAP